MCIGATYEFATVPIPPQRHRQQCARARHLTVKASVTARSIEINLNLNINQLLIILVANQKWSPHETTRKVSEKKKKKKKKKAVIVCRLRDIVIV
jgi:accessory gene regulator protein AgrB